jgi:EmrB/QacA subfamily drug resistance transporter
MVFLDGTIANVAARQIGTDFSAGFASLQWVLNGYALALASLILLGGSLGDRFGRRSVYLTGMVWFASASVLCALAPSVHILIAARVLQGIGGALLTPGSLSLIQASFAPQDTGRAVGLWSGMSGVSTAVGPLLGGYLVEHISWRWAFGINVPLAAVAMILALRYLPESRSDEEEGPLDLLGTVLIALGLGALTYGTTAAGDTGWKALSLACTLGGLAVLTLFVLVEARTEYPLLPPRLFRDRTFTGANLMTFTTYGSLGAVIFLLVLNLQVAGGYGPLAAGLATLPTTLLLLLLSPRAGALSARIGPRLPMIIGPVVAAVGIALTARIDRHHHSYLVDVLPGILVFGLGMSFLVAPLTSTVMASAPRNDVGLASGVNNAVARSAALLAVAVLPPLAGLTGERYRIPDVMAHGYRVVVAICVGLLVLGAVVVAFTLRSGTLMDIGRAAGDATGDDHTKEAHGVQAERATDSATDSRPGG